MSLAPHDEAPRHEQRAARAVGFFGRWTAHAQAFCFERLGIEDLQYLAAKKQVPRHRTTLFYFLGGMALFLFGIQVITGILLALYYKPSPDHAFESVRAIMTEIEYGWLMRSVHSWSANLLIGVLFLHLLTAYIMRAYRRPREVTWITGCLLLALFMAFGFSGYLLPWNQLAFFATKVGTAIMGQVPLVGTEFLRLARSGDHVTGDTLARFYALHVVVLPLAVFALLGVHLYLVQKHGMSIPEREAARRGGADQVPSMPFVPHFLLRDMVGWYVALGLLAALAALFPWELGEKLTNPFAETPAGTKPEWYFLFMFVTLEQVPGKLLGIDGATLVVLFFSLCGLIVLLVPFVDWGAERQRPRRILNFVATWAVFAFVFQTLVGMGVWFESEVQDPAQAAGVLGVAVLGSGLAAAVLWAIGFAVNRLFRFSAVFLLASMLVAVAAIAAEPPAPKAPEAPAAKAPGKPAEKSTEPKPNNCLFCHGNKEVWEGDQLRLFVTDKDFAVDIHWQRGLRCADCHGGNPAAEEVNEAHAVEDGFKPLRSRDKNNMKDFSKAPEPARSVELCGNCHANLDFMRPYNPTARVDQLREYWTSGHGRRVKEAQDTGVATCVSCHGTAHGTGRETGVHGIRRVADLNSPVYVTNVAKTCAKCHSDEKLMAGRTYHGRAIGHSQYEDWRESVHGKTLLEKGDLSAPTCNRCHGNHGALPPQIGSVANACGTCHGKNASLFANTRMRHAFEDVGLPGCATCHNAHKIGMPSDEMLGMTAGSVCARCHGQEEAKKKNPALARVNMKGIIAGGATAQTLRMGLEELKWQITNVDERLADVERLGMLVPGPESDPNMEPRLYLRKATDALTNARVQIHSFEAEPVEKVLAEGRKVVLEVLASTDKAREQYDFRRIWLAACLVPIGLVIVLLLVYIRNVPIRS